MGRRSRGGRIAALVCTTILCVSAWVSAGPGHGWATFHGAYFDIDYPAAFKVEPREPGAGGSLARPDGVSFLSPDGSVEFYVYSPLWSGEPEWIKLREGETEVRRTLETRGDKTLTWVRVHGPRRGYERFHVDIRQPDLNTRWVLGYRYSSTAAKVTYYPRFLKFSGTLKQYAD